MPFPAVDANTVAVDASNRFKVTRSTVADDDQIKIQSDGEESTGTVTGRQINRDLEVNVNTADERDVWSKKADFLLSVIGFAVDLANVWRFPYLCHKNGGGAFLIPYLLMFLIGGVPLFYLELALGQYIGSGAITSWGKICPLLKGVGYCVVIVSFYTDWFYNMIIAWAVYYLCASLTTSSVPWASCGHEWNSPTTCYDSHLSGPIGNATNMLKLIGGAGTNVSLLNASLRTFPVDEYFRTPDTIDVLALYKLYRRNVLNRSEQSSFTNLGSVNWLVALCFAVVMVICYFSLWKGIKTSSKVVWFTAIFPYVVLLTFFIRGLTLEGSFDGIYYYIVPDLSKLKNAEAWVDAATQIFFSLGPGFGVLMAYSSYNKFNNNVKRDAIIVASINSLTSFLSGFVVFSLLGYMAKRRGLDVHDVVKDGQLTFYHNNIAYPVLVFSVYPEALVSLPYAPIWSFVFFLMLITLGLDSSFGGTESIITALGDEFPIIARQRELFLLLLSVFYMIIGLLESTQGGIFLFNLFERMCVQYPLLIGVLLEVICATWIYGVDRLCENIKEMSGTEPGWFWRIAWKFLAPLFLLFNIGYGLASYEPLKLGTYTYPLSANITGWLLCILPLLVIPVVAVYQLTTQARGTLCERIKFLTKPSPDLCRLTRNGDNQKNLVDGFSSRSPSSPPYPPIIDSAVIEARSDSNRIESYLDKSITDLPTTTPPNDGRNRFGSRKIKLHLLRRTAKVSTPADVDQIDGESDQPGVYRG